MRTRREVKRVMDLEVGLRKWEGRMSAGCCIRACASSTVRICTCACVCACVRACVRACARACARALSLIHISEPTRRTPI
eukprot:1565614-Pleurochrysis_carterae.AAC.1